MQLPRFIRHLLVKTLTFFPSEPQVKKYSCVHGKSHSDGGCWTCSDSSRLYPNGKALQLAQSTVKIGNYFENI